MQEKGTFYYYSKVHMFSKTLNYYHGKNTNVVIFVRDWLCQITVGPARPHYSTYSQNLAFALCKVKAMFSFYFLYCLQISISLI